MDLSTIARHMDDVTVILTGIAAILGAWWGFVNWVAPFLKEIYRSFKQLDVIASEFRTNGGSSLRDAINRLEDSVSAVRQDALKMEARQWAIIATLRDPIFEANKEGLCIRANPSYLNLVERSLDEVIDNGWENILHPEDRDRVWTEWAHAIERERTFESSYRIRSSSNAIYLVTCVAIPYFAVGEGGDNSPIGYIGRFESVKRLNKPTK